MTFDIEDLQAVTTFYDGLTRLAARDEKGYDGTPLRFRCGYDFVLQNPGIIAF